jgi:hypothetical protein
VTRSVKAGTRTLTLKLNSRRRARCAPGRCARSGERCGSAPPTRASRPSRARAS